MALILFAAAVPRRVMVWAAGVIAGSVLGSADQRVAGVRTRFVARAV